MNVNEIAFFRPNLLFYPFSDLLCINVKWCTMYLLPKKCRPATSECIFPSEFNMNTLIYINHLIQMTEVCNYEKHLYGKIFKTLGENNCTCSWKRKKGGKIGLSYCSPFCLKFEVNWIIFCFLGPSQILNYWIMGIVWYLEFSQTVFTLEFSGCRADSGLKVNLGKQPCTIKNIYMSPFF